MGKISNFLIKSHKSKDKRDQNFNKIETNDDKTNSKWIPKDNVVVSKNIEIKLCSKCGSPNIEIVYGRYGYYFKCKKCNGNTTIKLKCKNDSCKVIIRKAKLKFYKECSSCGTSELYFENNVGIEVSERIKIIIFSNNLLTEEDYTPTDDLVELDKKVSSLVKAWVLQNANGICENS